MHLSIYIHLYTYTYTYTHIHLHLHPHPHLHLHLHLHILEEVLEEGVLLQHEHAVRGAADLEAAVALQEQGLRARPIAAHRCEVTRRRYTLRRRGVTWCSIRRFAREVYETTTSAVRCDMVSRRAFRARRLKHEMQHLTSTGSNTFKGLGDRHPARGVLRVPRAAAPRRAGHEPLPVLVLAALVLVFVLVLVL